MNASPGFTAGGFDRTWACTGGADHVETPARRDDVGRCLRPDGTGRAVAPAVLSSRGVLLGGTDRCLRDRGFGDHSYCPAGRRSGMHCRDSQRRAPRRQRRAAVAARIAERTHPAAGDPAWPFRTPDRVAAGAVPNLRPASRQWLPDAAPEQGVAAMDHNEQRLRMADSGMPPAASASVTEIPNPLEALPADALILIPTRNLVLFPGTVLPITLGRQRSTAAAQAAVRLSRPIGLILQRDPAMDEPMPVDLHRVGTEANLLRYVTSPDGSHHVSCQGRPRFRVIEFLDGFPFFVGRVERLAEPQEQSKEIDARLLNLRNQALEVLQLLTQTP